MNPDTLFGLILFGPFLVIVAGLMLVVRQEP